MYGGDEVNAIVLDLGAGGVKAGYAGEDTPKAFFPSVVGCLEGLSAADGKAPQRQRFVGSQALGFRRDHMEVVPALVNGLYSDWELVEDLWNHALSDRLRVEPKEHPIMLAEPSFQPREARERVVARIFEGFSAPALFLAKNAALSSYATGRQTSLVVDLGCEGTVGAHTALFLAGNCVFSGAHLLTPHTCFLPVQACLSHTTQAQLWQTQHAQCLRSAASLLPASAAGSGTSAGCPRSS